MLVFRRGEGRASEGAQAKLAEKKEELQSLAPEQLLGLHARIRHFLNTNLEPDATTKILDIADGISDVRERTMYLTKVVQAVHQQRTGQNVVSLKEYAEYKWKPVEFITFCTHEAFLNKAQEIYPEVLKAGQELNSGKYVEAVLTGGIGSGKTTLALYTNAYQVYLLSCLRHPHKMFGLDPSSEILFIFQSITKGLAQGLDYQRFRSMLEGSPYFKDHFPFERELESKLVFPDRIEVKPVSGSETAAIGQNVMGGLIDELNYMAVVEKSKSSADGGTYDQAVTLYNSIARRRKSRFMNQGKLPGILCLVSSKKYPGQFTDVKMEEAKSDPTIFVYDKRMWEIKPDSFGESGWFRVFSGDLTRKPRIMEPHEKVAEADQALVVSIPEDFREDFKKDIINALREVAGVSTLARHPFFMEVDKVGAAFRKKRQSVFKQTRADFVDQKVELVKSALIHPDLPRFAHVDLAISGDSCGLCIGCVTGFKNVGTPTEPVMMPRIWIDGILEIKPPRNSEILFSKVREVLIALKDKLGLNIRWVTFDQFQSTDSQQILRQRGFITGQQSVDGVPCTPYDFLKAAFYEDRLVIPAHTHVQTELLQLEKDSKTGRVDHPPTSSKDCADALAGVVYGLTMRRESWYTHGIEATAIPRQMMDASEAMSKKSEDKRKTAYQDVEVDEKPRPFMKDE